MVERFSPRQVNDAVYTQNGPGTFDIKTGLISLHTIVYCPEKGPLGRLF